MTTYIIKVCSIDNFCKYLITTKTGDSGRWSLGSVPTEFATVEQANTAKTAYAGIYPDYTLTIYSRVSTIVDTEV